MLKNSPTSTRPLVPSLDKPFWTIGETGIYLGLTDKSVRAIINQKLLTVYRVGVRKGRLRIKPEDVFVYLETIRSGPKPEAARATPMPRNPEKTKTPIMDELLAKRASRRAKRQASA
jgi:hypothetical protein